MKIVLPLKRNVSGDLSIEFYQYQQRNVESA